jgi:hypothetical protein
MIVATPFKDSEHPIAATRRDTIPTQNLLINPPFLHMKMQVGLPGNQTLQPMLLHSDVLQFSNPFSGAT